MSTARKYYAAEYFDLAVQAGLLDGLEYGEACDLAAERVELARGVGLLLRG